MPQNRRAADANMLSYALRLFAGEVVTSFVRKVCLSIAMAFGYFGFGLLFRIDQPAWQNPVFDGVFTAAQPWIWGTTFWIAGALMLVVAISGRALVYLIALVFGAGVLLSWCTGIIYQAVISDEAHLTEGALALYQLAFTAIIGLAASPRPLEMHAEIYEREGDRLVPVEKIERRAG